MCSYALCWLKIQASRDSLYLNGVLEFFPRKQIKTAVSQVRQRALGEKHPDTAVSYAHAAYNLNAQGHYDEAEPLYRTSLKITEEALGSDHPTTQKLRNNLYIFSKNRK